MARDQKTVQRSGSLGLGMWTRTRSSPSANDCRIVVKFGRKQRWRRLVGLLELARLHLRRRKRGEGRIHLEAVGELAIFMFGTIASARDAERRGVGEREMVMSR
jgi:hypothetical protein